MRMAHRPRLVNAHGPPPPARSLISCDEPGTHRHGKSTVVTPQARSPPAAIYRCALKQPSPCFRERPASFHCTQAPTSPSPPSTTPMSRWLTSAARSWSDLTCISLPCTGLHDLFELGTRHAELELSGRDPILILYGRRVLRTEWRSFDRLECRGLSPPHASCRLSRHESDRHLSFLSAVCTHSLCLFEAFRQGLPAGWI